MFPLLRESMTAPPALPVSPPVSLPGRALQAMRRHWRAAVFALAALAYAALSFRAASQTAAALSGVLLGFVPLTLLLLWLAWRSPRRLLWLPLLALLIALSGLHGAWLLQHYRWAYLAQHVGAMLFLGVGFGSSLLPGREPMVSRFARQLHGSLSARQRRYTRAVTWTWTLFFAAMALTSLLLFAYASAAQWALFAELLTPLLVVALFAAEYLVRLCALPAHERAGPVASLLAFARYRTRQRQEHA